MAFKKVELFQFRNINQTHVLLEDGINILYGDNGQGKTSFLESLYFLSRGKSFRTLDTYHCVQEVNQSSVEKPYQGIAVLHSVFEDQNNVKNNFKIELTKNKKTFWLNQKRTLSTKLSTVCPSVLFSPESLTTIKDGPSERRELIDDFIEQLPEFSSSVTTYKKILKSRNKILNDVKRELKKESEVRNTLIAINDLFFKHALDLIELRFHFLEVLQPYVQDAVKYIFGEKTEFKFKYIISSSEIKQFEYDKIGTLLRQRSLELYYPEMSTGYSLIGPHKHEIQFIFNGKDSRYYCSQGQQRALIIAFKIAEVLFRLSQRNEKPVLLLDDVMSELDEGKKIKLVDFLKSVNSQIVITTTDRSKNLEKSMGPHAQFKITNGELINL